MQQSDIRHQASPTWSLITKVVILLIVLLALGSLVHSFREALPPLVVACLIAYILTPLVNNISARTRMPRGLATLLIYLAFIAGIGLVVGWSAPLLVRQIASFQVNMQDVTAAIEGFLTRQYTVGGFVFDFSQIYTELQKELAGLIRPAVTQTLALAAQAVTTIVWVIFIWIVSFYLIKDGPGLIVQIEKWIPPTLRFDYRRLLTQIDQVWRDFFRGQLVVGMVMGLSILVIMGVIGLPNVLILALLAASLEFLPSVGHVIWLLVAVPLALFQGSLWLPLPNFWFAMLVLGLHLILEQVDLNIYIPRFVGRRVHLHPLVVIVGIIIGGILAGVLGIFLAAPIISSLRVLFRYTYCKLLDIYPWVEDEEPGQVPAAADGPAPTAQP